MYRAALFAIPLSVIGISLWTYSAVYAHRSCTSGESADRQLCFAELAREISKEKGAAAAIAYADTYAHDFDYHQRHLFLHEVGHEAYHAHHNLNEALSYFETHQANASPSAPFDYAFDGFRHGVFMEYFGDHSERRATELARDVCSAYYDLAEAGSDVTAEQCFHGVGHALMHKNDNNAAASLADCDALPFSWMQQWCAYGVVMHVAYLSRPSFEPEHPRDTPITVEAFCSSVSEKYKNTCSRLIGRGVLSGGGTIADAFAACTHAETAYREDCVVETAAPSVPMAHASEPEHLFDECTRFNAYRSACVFGAASGYQLGWGVFGKKVADICDFAPQENVADCRRANGRGYTAL